MEEAKAKKMSRKYRSKQKTQMSEQEKNMVATK